MIIETERLVLRPPEPADFDEFLALRADPAVRRHLGGPVAGPAARRQFAAAATAWMLGRPSLFVARLRPALSGGFVGVVGPWGLFGSDEDEMVWELAAAHWGRGLAYEAACAVLDRLFVDPARAEALFYIAPRNVASLALARKLGAAPDLSPRAAGPMHRPGDLRFVCSRWDWLTRAAFAAPPPRRAAPALAAAG